MGIIIVAVLGLAVNILGLFMFHGHGGHSHGGHSHGHSHGVHHHGADEHEHKHAFEELAEHATSTTATPRSFSPTEDGEVALDPEMEEELRAVHEVRNILPQCFWYQGSCIQRMRQAAQQQRSPSPRDHRESPVPVRVRTERKKKADLNLHSVFLHVLGDALGSVGVLISGFCIMFMPTTWAIRSYIDPTVSVLIALILLKSSIPVVKQASRILLQAVPDNVNLTEVRSELEDVDGVLNVHDLHCWLLADSMVIASLHVLIKPDGDFMRIMQRFKKILHRHNIHSWTIQPEFGDGTDATVREKTSWFSVFCLLHLSCYQCLFIVPYCFHLW